MSFAHNFPFDPTGGYTPEQLLNLKVELDEPADFERFWQQTYQWAMSRPLNWEMRPSESHAGDQRTEVFDISFDSCYGKPGNRVGGWLTLPRGRPVRRGAVCTHGYGGRNAPDLSQNLLLPPDADAAVIFPVLSGLPSRSLFPQEGIGNDGSGSHVLIGIGHRDTYIHRFCAMDVWRAASVLLEAIPALNGVGIDYIGGSFGGGIGALALPWDGRFRRAHLGVPSFGNHPLRLQIPCSGSGEAVRLHAQTHPEVSRDVLPYFDAAIAARHIRIPVHAEAAFFDPTVTPVGQYSVYHNLGGPKKLFAISAGHFAHRGTPAEMERLFKQIRDFLA